MSDVEATPEAPETPAEPTETAADPTTGSYILIEFREPGSAVYTMYMTGVVAAQIGIAANVLKFYSDEHMIAEQMQQAQEVASKSGIVLARGIPQDHKKARRNMRLLDG